MKIFHLTACILILTLMVCNQAIAQPTKGSKHIKKSEAVEEMTFEAGNKNSRIKWNVVKFNFGNIPYGSDARYTYYLKNVSKDPISLVTVTPSCGCTTSSFSQEPILPGGVGQITVRYDSSKIGEFDKTLTVNIGYETIILYIKGNVQEPTDDLP